MNEVVAIVEGQTEQAFVRDHLASHLGARGVVMWATLPGRVVKRGGVRAWESVRGDILRTIQERRGRICTTMFDFYAMPQDWPGRTDAAKLPLDQKGDHVEKALLDELAAHAGDGFRQELFIPYVQVHEFEALLFSDVTKIAEVLSPIAGTPEAQISALLKAVLDKAGQAEAINDNYETCPSRRISSLVKAYRKPAFGAIIAGRIGLDAMKAACPHFGKWVARLESLGQA
jgi:hypothetical protein